MPVALGVIIGLLICLSIDVGKRRSRDNAVQEIMRYSVSIVEVTDRICEMYVPTVVDLACRVERLEKRDGRTSTAEYTENTE